jgi:urease accessory protein
VDAHARIVVEPSAADGGVRATTLHTPAPLGARMAGGALQLLGTAAGPLGGDRLRLTLHVRTGAHLTVRAVAATVAQRGDGTPSTHHVEVRVDAGASLRWLVEPLVAAADCDHRASATVALAGDALLLWREELVLGRSGEEPGCCTTTLRITRDGAPLLHHELTTARPGWRSPAVLGDARAVGQVAAVGVALRAPEAPPASVEGGGRHALLDLGAGVRLAVALAADHAALRLGLATEDPGLACAPGPATVGA